MNIERKYLEAEEGSKENILYEFFSSCFDSIYDDMETSVLEFLRKNDSNTNSKLTDALNEFIETDEFDNEEKANFISGITAHCFNTNNIIEWLKNVLDILG